MTPKLGYWNIRGLAQPIRLMLAYVEAKFEDKKYAYGPSPKFDRSAWLNEKFTLGLDFPNLPYYIDGDVKLTQSLVIMRYIARKYKLDAENESERLKTDIIEQQVSDFRSGFTRIAYSPEFEQLKEDYLKNLPLQLKLFSEFLGERKWFAADRITYVDFMMYEALDQHKFIDEDFLNDFQNLKDFIERFEKQSTIHKYMKSEEFMKWPLNGDMAVFGSRSSRK